MCILLLVASGALPCSPAAGNNKGTTKPIRLLECTTLCFAAGAINIVA